MNYVNLPLKKCQEKYGGIVIFNNTDYLIELRCKYKPPKGLNTKGNVWLNLILESRPLNKYIFEARYCKIAQTEWAIQPSKMYTFKNQEYK